MYFLEPIEEVDETNIQKFNSFTTNPNKHIFLFLYMDGCGPCNQTKETWKDIQKNIKKDFISTTDKSANGVVAEINHVLYNKLENVGEEPNAFPTLRYIKGNTIEEYNGHRTTNAFVEWIESKLGNKQDGGRKRRKTRRTHKSIKSKKTRKTKKIKGGKWSLKYKRSINCNKPKGFSQKQHCKYGRKK